MKQELEPGLELDTKKEIRAKERVEKVQKKKQNRGKSWEDILHNPKTSKLDQQRLEETYKAFKEKKIFPESPLSKAEVLRMYARLVEITKKEKIEKMVRETPKNFHLIQTKNQLWEVCRMWQEEKEPVGLDTETNGLDIVFGDDHCVGISISFPTPDVHVYIPVRHNTGEKQIEPELVFGSLKLFLSDERKEKVLHNAKFDSHVFSMEGVPLRGIRMDTMLAMWCLNENEPSYKLKNLANKYAKFIGVPAENDTFGELFGGKTFDEIPLDVALVYAAKDTMLTVKFFKFIENQMNRKSLNRVRKLYYELENPLLSVCAAMEEAGWLLNKEKVKQVRKDLQGKQNALLTGMKETFGDINFNSPVQLQRVLYDELNLPDVSKKRSTDKATLKKLATNHDEVQMLLDYRKVTKLLTAFIDKLPEMVKRTGRVYGQFNQNGAATGRFASRNPNLQQLPPSARVIFKAPEGKILIGSDFSQIEPRTLSHISGDAELQKPYKEGHDLYSTLASRVFDLPIEQCGDGTKPRKHMKVGLLAVMYGTSMFTLAKQLEITVEEADDFITNFYHTYPKVGEWIHSVHMFVKKHEYVETLFGRKRRFPHHRREAIVYDQCAEEIKRRLGMDKIPTNIWDNKYKRRLPYPLKRRFQNVKGHVERVRRQSVNAVIQGTAADVMKIAMIRMSKVCEKHEGWQILGTVHDEALLEIPENVTKEQIKEVEDAMIHAVNFDVPLKVDVAFMHEWGNEIPKDEWFKGAE